MNIIMVVINLFKHENTWRIGKIENILNNFSENIRTNRNGFIRQQNGLICQRTGLIRARIKPVSWRIKPVRQKIKPVHLVLIFLFFPFSSNVCILSVERVLPPEPKYKTAYYEILCLITEISL